ncbi:MAG: hypothetical protein JHC95_14710 [Solirubrobacteraceae bacterium]|nr:hypothetical protein [Solirubrobacteraceae bacterium]
MPRPRRALFAVLVLAALTGAAPAAAAPVETGTLRELVVDPVSHDGQSTTTTVLETATGTTVVPDPSDADRAYVGRRVAARVTNEDVDVLGPLQADVDPAPVTHKLAVVLVNFPDDTRTPYTKAQAESDVLTGSRAMVNYYDEMSGGDIGFSGSGGTGSGDVYGWYAMTGITAAECGGDSGVFASKFVTEMNAGNYTTSDARINLAAYDKVMFVMPYQGSACGWGGIGYVPGKYSWISNPPSGGTPAHEMGHNLGLKHSSSMTCTSGGVAVAISSSCTTVEYGDPYDVMGVSSNYRYVNNWNMQKLGLLDTGNVTTVTSSQSVSLTSSIAGGNAIVRVPALPAGGFVDASTNYYYLELRKPNGVFDNFLTTDSPVVGVNVRLAPDSGTSIQSKLLAARPASGITEGSLRVGSVFNDPTNDIQIRVDALASNVATVAVSYHGAGASDFTPPTAPGTPTLTRQGTSVKIDWTGSTDANGVRYRVLRNGTAIATNLTTTTSTDSSAVAGAAYKIAAYDPSGNTTESAVAILPAADTTPPTAPSAIAFARAGANVHISWAASTDASGPVTYRVYRDGIQIVTGLTALSYDDSGLDPAVGYWYHVYAFDAVGNWRGSAATWLAAEKAVTPPTTTSDPGDEGDDESAEEEAERAAENTAKALRASLAKLKTSTKAGKVILQATFPAKVAASVTADGRTLCKANATKLKCVIVKRKLRKSTNKVVVKVTTANASASRTITVRK